MNKLETDNSSANTSVSQNSPPPTARLTHFPVSFFSMVMGLAGLCIAWEKTLDVLAIDFAIPYLLASIALLAFAILTGIYLLKAVRHPESVRAEIQHPIKLNFFASVPISLILLSITTLPLQKELSLGLWVSGTALQLAVLLFIMNTWLHSQHFKTEHLNPAWFIPAVGNMLVPLSGIAHGFPEISWFFFSVGMLFWLVLLTIIFNRILFHQPIPEKLLPTLFILIAPPAVGFVAYIKLSGFDAFAHVLYYIALFFTILLFTQIKRFIGLPFFLSWWAYSFPLAAVTVASWVMFEMTGLIGLKLIALTLLTLLSLLVILLLVKTAQAIMAERICIPE